jgi:hypothetical protein
VIASTAAGFAWLSCWAAFRWQPTWLTRPPAETALKDSLMSVAFARHLGLTGHELSDVYYLALTSHLGCTSYAEELGDVAAGDDASMRRAYAEADYADRPELLRLAVTEVASKSGPLDRVRVVARFVGAGRGLLLGGNTAICEAAPGSVNASAWRPASRGPSTRSWRAGTARCLACRPERVCRSSHASPT